MKLRRITLPVLLWMMGSAATSCSFRSPPLEERVTVTVTEVARPSVWVSAIPYYRLIVDRSLSNGPSRLVLLYARIETPGSEPLYFDPIKSHLLLPDGTHARLLDRARATVLLNRTRLAAWSPASDAAAPRTPGLFQPEVEEQLREQITQSLMGAGVFTHDQPLTGYLLVDTGSPLESLDDVTFEVVASRTGDEEPIREVYRFASTSVSQPSP